MSDLFDSIGSAIGGAAEFLTPTTERRGASLFDFGDLLNTAVDVGRNSALGGVSALDDVLVSDSSWKQKLFMGGLVAAGVGGAAMGARQLAAQQKVERQLMPVPAVSRWTPAQGELGLPPRYAPETAEGSAIVRQHPGIKPRTADVLGAPDTIETARRLGTPALQDPVRLANASTLVSGYAAMLQDVPAEGRLGAAQLDLAKIDTAVEAGIIRTYKGQKGIVNEDFVELWQRFRSGDLDPNSMEAQTFLDMARQFGEATNDIVEPDLSFDAVARVVGVDFTEAGVIIKTKIPDWDANGPFLDPAVRSERIRSLNLRPLAARGKEFMQRLYKMGIQEEQYPGTLPRPLEKGSGWYPKASKEVDEALPQLADVPWVDKDRLLAAVSLTSEAEKWEGNVALAVSALKRSNTPEVLDPDFQAWLRNDQWSDAVNQVDRQVYTGTRAAEHEATFERLHEEVKRGNQLDATSYKKVLRLAAESPDSVFRSTSGRKQKNFYLNLRDPDDTGPITIDRHMHDVFLGLASSSDFKLLEGQSLSDSHYDVIADVLREAADELGVTPNELQGVVWEAWKALKEAHRAPQNDPWLARDPFRLKEADGSENAVLDMLQGKLGTNVADAMKAVPDRIMFVEGIEGRGLYATPDDRLGVIGPKDAATAAIFRHLRPALDRSDGISFWGPSQPRRVRDLEATRASLNNGLSGHRTETWSNSAWPEGHPATLPGDHIMLEIPDGPLPKGLAGQGRVIDPGQPALVGANPRSNEKLRQRSLDPATFDNPEKSPLFTHDWVSLEAAPKPDGTGGGDFNTLLSELREAGYDPIEQVGWYEGQSNRSVLVLGMPVDEGLKFGKRYNQESIAANGGLFFMDGTAMPAEGVKFVQDASAGGSVATVRGNQFSWTLDGIDWDADPVPAGEVLQRENRRSRQVALSVRRSSDIPAALDELAKFEGVKVQAVYSTGQPPVGYVRAREHVYQDTANTMMVRTADPEIDSPHGYDVWVSKADADGLPRKNLEGRRVRKNVQTQDVGNGDVVVDGQVLVRLQGATPNLDVTKVKLDGKRPSFLVFNFGGEIPEVVPWFADAEPAGDLVARISNGGLVIDADPADLTAPARAVDVLGQLGVDPSDVRINVGDSAVSAEFVEPKAPRGVTNTVFGDQLPKLRKTSSPLPHWQEKYGFWFDPAYRNKRGHIRKVNPELIEELDIVTERVMRDHAEIVHMTGLARIGFDNSMPDDWAAAFTFDPAGGSEMHLNPSWFGEDSDVDWHATRLNDIRTNEFSPNLPPSAGAVVAHEFGHAIHFGLRETFRTKGEAKDFDKKVLGKLKKSVGGRKAMEKALSRYGSSNIEEFVAEALAEAIFADAPRSLAVEVYRLVLDQYRQNTVWRKKVWAA